MYVHIYMYMYMYIYMCKYSALWQAFTAHLQECKALVPKYTAHVCIS